METELANTLEVLRGCCGAPGALTYFLELAEAYFCRSQSAKQNEVLIVGSSFPEELLWANHLRPHWIIGGGLSIGAAIDSRVPRDADAISRSMFGYLEEYLKDTDRSTPIILPITGDNLRKISYLLQEEGRYVLPIDITPETTSGNFCASLQHQLHEIMEKLTLTWSLPGAGRRLYRTSRTIRLAKETAAAVLTDPKLHMSGLLKLFLLNTYFYTENVTQWTEHLTTLAKALAACPAPADETMRPGVLIVGSPVMFPNYKVPILLERAGLSVVGTCDSVSGKVLELETKSVGKSRTAQLCRLIQQTYGNDCAGAFVQNRALYDRTERLLNSLDIQGVIFHIMKGQIEYDFELERMEALFAAHKLPVFRLETDYHDNDVEQLRIRLEAFAELLMQDITR